MVDRIVPATTDDDRADVARLVGGTDRAPVIHEPFWQWVLEDEFGPMGRPDFAHVGVQMVADVTPYEMMKLRCLNGSHTALALLGQLHGKQLISEAIADPLLAGFINSLWTRRRSFPRSPFRRERISPPIAGRLTSVFSNPRIIHQTSADRDGHLAEIAATNSGAACRKSYSWPFSDPPLSGACWLAGLCQTDTGSSATGFTTRLPGPLPRSLLQRLTVTAMCGLC